MSGHHQVHTATPIRHRENFGVTSAASARDHTHAVTGQMFAPTPYDCTTPPWLVQTSPFPNFPVQQTSTNTSPASPFADPRLPRPAPREHCLQDDLFYAFTRDAYLSSETTAANEVARNLQLHYPRQEYTHRTLPPPRITRQVLNTNNNNLQFFNPFTPLTPQPSNTFKMEVTSRPLPSLLPQSAPMASKPVSAAPWSFPNLKKRRRRRASQIFNMNFSFGFTSRRKSSDRSVEVSPRTSISSASGSPRSEMEESCKRQRVDSRATDAEAHFASEKGTIMPNTEKPAVVLSPSTRCDSTGEVHPGQLVDFTSTPAPVAPAPIVAPAPTHSNPASEFELRLSSDAYHDYLATTQRRRSFPAGEWAARRVREEFQMLHKLEKLDAKIEDPFKKFRESAKRLCTVERKAKSSATASPNIIAPTPVADAPNGPCELRRTPSDPSTEAFLTHVRASLEARKKESKAGERGRSYSIFADEVEKGFLDDAPL